MKYLLYADDDTDDQELLSDLVGNLEPGIQTKCFTHGQPLISYLDALTPVDILPCCIVLDLNMPGWDGLQTLEAIRSRARWNDLPVIIFSTSNLQSDADRARKLGATAFITKPFTSEEFTIVTKRFQGYCHPGTVVADPYKSSEP